MDIVPPKLKCENTASVQLSTLSSIMERFQRHKGEAVFSKHKIKTIITREL